MSEAPEATPARHPVVPRALTVLAVVVGAVAIYLSGPVMGRVFVGLAAVAAVFGAFDRPRQGVWSRVAIGLLISAVAALGGHLLSDDFGVLYVWLYSASDLAWYLKLANLWGGDEGVLLFLSALAGLGALRLRRYGGWAASGALLITAFLAMGATVWSPFVATPDAERAAVESQGMNAHLINGWMTLHPPAVFIAFGLFIAPLGAAVQALATGEGPWREIATRWTRYGWTVLSIGLVAGMWWAYEDFTFGQFWHWDPVQTAVFVVWALATAHLHTLRRYRPNGAFVRLHPMLGLLTGCAAAGSLVITRLPTLASSHRYVGETSWPWLLAGTGLLLLATAVAFALSWRRRIDARSAGEHALLIRVAAILLVVCAGVAAYHIGEALAREWRDVPKPDSLKPFFAFIARWSSSAETERLAAAFDQWDIDRFSIDRWLAPAGVLIGMVGGHYFLPIASRWWRWGLSTAVAAFAAVTALYLSPVERLYGGHGMTSSATTAIFPWLDALAVAVLYLALSALASGIVTVIRHGRHRIALRYALPVGLVHAGIVLALVSATAAGVFDSYEQRQLSYPGDFAVPQKFGDYQVSVRFDGDGYLRDGGRGEEKAAFHAIADVDWSLARDGEVVEAAQGRTLYRDARPPTPRGLGPIRLMCAMIDYRYARYLSGDRQVMDPFIHRGLWRDVQVWLPAPNYDEGEDGPEAVESRVPVVLKVFPMMTWLWVGMLVALAAAIAAGAFEIGASRRRAGR